MQPATDVGVCVGKYARSNLPVLWNSTLTVVIRRLPIGNNNQTSSNQLQALFTAMRHWEELFDIIEENCDLKEPYNLNAISWCNLM